MLRAILFLLLLTALCARAQDLPHLRDGDSPDHRYDCRLLNADGKLRFLVVAKDGGKPLAGDIPSAYEALLKTNDNAADLARRTRVYWSPDGQYLVFREPDNSATTSAVILASVKPEGVKVVPIDMEKMKALSPRKHTDWSVEFGNWIGKRMFSVRLYGMTFQQDKPNEHDEIAVVCHIKKDGDVAMSNADE